MAGVGNTCENPLLEDGGLSPSDVCNEEQYNEIYLLLSAYPEKNKISITKEEKGTFLHIRIELITNGNEITVCAFLEDKQSSNEAGNNTDSESKADDNLHEVDGAKAAEAEDGMVSLVQQNVHHLTPLRLSISLRPDYTPGGDGVCAPPHFTLCSGWASPDQLTSLASQLDRLWSEHQGEPILMIWVQWLEDDAFDFLGFLTSPKVILTHSDATADDLLSRVDPRVHFECTSVFDAMRRIIEHNSQVSKEAFLTSWIECPICCMERMGSNFVQLGDCGHTVCSECLAELIRQHVQEGTVQHIRCPMKCTCELYLHVFRQYLDDKEYQRWESLTLQRGLECMADVNWCPRCNTPGVSPHGTDDKLGMCPSCFYSFCCDCGASWHGDGVCDVSTPAPPPPPVQMTESQRRPHYETMRKKKENQLAEQVIRTSSKRCPCCRVPIYKFAGCNKVTCSQCRAFMCYACGKRIENYDHFNNPNSKCVLFDFIGGAEVWQRARDMEALRPVIQLGVPDDPNVHWNRCPNCRAPNIKNDRNNHLRCPSCRTNHCYLCRQKIVGTVTDHFAPSKPCVQHSDH